MIGEPITDNRWNLVCRAVYGDGAGCCGAPHKVECGSDECVTTMCRDIEKFIDGYFMMKSALNELAFHGIRVDLTPTMHEGNMAHGSQVGYSVGFVYQYLRSADSHVREAAKRTIDSLPSGGA